MNLFLIMLSLSLFVAQGKAQSIMPGHSCSAQLELLDPQFVYLDPNFTLDSQIWLNNQALSLKGVKQSLTNSKLFKIGINKIREISKEIPYLTTVAEDPANFHKNRYKDIVAHDESRTCSELADFYLNGSDITTSNGTYLAAQGPLEHTIGDFWKAILHRQSRIIVTLVMAVEEGADKCSDWWKKERFPALLDNWEINFLSERVLCGHSKGHQLVERLFYLSNIESNEKRILTQLHYENWPDGGIPDFTIFQQLLDEVDARNSYNFPITVHCSAGIGRTGTFIASHALRKEVRKKMAEGVHQDQILLNIPSTIMMMRLQRKGLVGSSRQLKIIYKTVALEYKNKT